VTREGIAKGLRKNMLVLLRRRELLLFTNICVI
jgi:hypothetical protein